MGPACKPSGVRLLDTAIPETVVDFIRLGAMVIECVEETAMAARQYTRRRMPV